MSAAREPAGALNTSGAHAGAELGDRFLPLALLIALFPFVALPTAARAERVQLELILAVDASLSVSDQEFALQLDGLAAAFRNEAVLAAIRAVGDDGIAVLLLQWSDRTQQRVAVDWTAIRDASSAAAFADRIARSGRAFGGAGTAIARALESCIPLFHSNRFRGDRLVIDLSGDGIDNRGPVPTRMRDLAVTAGITVNGLAILNEDRYLDIYYAQNVVGGTGAFVLKAADYEDFAEAIVRKLIREISDAPMAEAPRDTPAGGGLLSASAADPIQ